MRGRSGIVTLVVGLVALSAAFYALDYALFHDARDLAFYTLLNLAFLPIEVLLVGLVLNRIIAEREKRSLLNKLNMVIGAFFSEVGTELIGSLNAFDADFDAIRRHLLFTSEWRDPDFVTAAEALAGAEVGIDSRRRDMTPLARFLLEKRSFLLGLLENPNLLEHERFTDVLWAVLHLAEELQFRDSLEHLPETDYAHLSGDMKRAYVALLGEWLQHMRHLKDAYPYLYSLAVRTNPFDTAATVEVTA